MGIFLISEVPLQPAVWRERSLSILAALARARERTRQQVSGGERYIESGGERNRETERERERERGDFDGANSAAQCCLPRT